jgi:hypothetical protein
MSLCVNEQPHRINSEALNIEIVLEPGEDSSFVAYIQRSRSFGRRSARLAKSAREHPRGYRSFILGVKPTDEYQ